MAYQKLQTQRAIAVFPTDDVTVPSPSDLVSSGTNNSVLANHLVDSTASFTGKVKPGATIYNTTDSTVATVEAVSDTSLRLSADIFTATGKAYSVYNTDNSDGPVLYVGTGGTLSIITVGGDSVTLTNVADGSFIPIMIGAVQNTGTSASGIIALW
tara:strand:+ start:374 stop:841 length:468 start_codon:yes stop_codon:yes gene_type:complete